MRQFKRLTWLVGSLLFFSWHTLGQSSLELVNNQPFPIRLPLEIRDLHLPKLLSWSGQAVQQSGSNLVLIANLDANEHKQFRFGDSRAARRKTVLSLEATDSGIHIVHAGTSRGGLSWDIILRDTTRRSRTETPVKLDAEAAFKPLPIAFRKAASGPVFDDWQGEATRDGLKLSLALRSFHDGFLDIGCRLMNMTADSTSNVYAAVVCRWDQERIESRAYCYDNHILPLAGRGSSSFREGDGRHLFIQRGVDWIRTTFPGHASAAWLNDFAPSFTVAVPATARSPAHFTGANLPQLGQEVQTSDQRLFSITEIARSSIRSFRDRIQENILPPRGEFVSFSSRLIFEESTLRDQEADQLFVAWTSYLEQRATPAGKRVSFGMASVRFGTSYFPYSTLGENFDAQKLPGMDRESFWPLAADTVNQWPLFADDIRRDLRIAKAMGFELIRLHHLELLAPIEKTVRQKYLDFLFGELRHLKLKALVDIYAAPAQIAELLTRYGDAVDGVEIENEVLIWGIPADRPSEWKEVYAAAKKAAPQARVHFTGYNNTGMFDRLNALGVPYDRVGLHSYIDTLEALPSARGYALALSSYAAKAGKEALITEWNWRGLTRMSEAARAKIYPQIIEGAVATRGIADFYQFQFNETLCPNPRLGRGNILRHYELLHLSRRPKAEALVLADLIRKYSAADGAARQIEIPHTVIELDSSGNGAATVMIKNTTSQRLNIRPTVETGADLLATTESGTNDFLSPGQERNCTLKISARHAQPGFYHAFLRLETGEFPGRGLVRYGWIEARLAGPPKFEGEAAQLDWTKPVTVVYGQDAPPLEVETAIAIAETLESASGSRIEAIQASDLPPGAEKRKTLLLVGTRSSNKLIAVSGSASPRHLMITGADSRAVEIAGIEFILGYWKQAKDSAARRVGLATKDLPKGGDAAKLP